MPALLNTALVLVFLTAVYLVVSWLLEKSRIIITDETYVLARRGETVEVYRTSQRRVPANFLLSRNRLLGRIRLEDNDDVLIVERAQSVNYPPPSTPRIEYQEIDTVESASRDEAVQLLLDYWEDQQEKRKARSNAIKKLTT